MSPGSYARDITFLLGFYVSLVAKRWWEQYRLLPWPDNLAMMLSGDCDAADAILRRGHNEKTSENISDFYTFPHHYPTHAVVKY